MYLKDSSESLFRIGPRTPMGEVMRCFWVPVLLEHELPRPDDEPVEVRLFGEDLITACHRPGAVALIDRYFKEMEPYPTVAQGGVVWTYMGPKGFTPQLPRFAWLALPPIKRAFAKHVEACNWSYALEASLGTEDRPFFLPPIYTSPLEDRGHAFVPVDDSHTLVWTFAAHGHPKVEDPIAHVDLDAIADFQHRMVTMARDNARGHIPESASHGDWYAGRPFPD